MPYGYGSTNTSTSSGGGNYSRSYNPSAGGVVSHSPTPSQPSSGGHDYEGEAYGTPDTIADIRAQEKAEAEIAMQKTIREAEAEEQRAAQLAVEVAAAAAKRNIQQHTGNGGGGSGGQAASRAGGGSQQAQSGGSSPSGGWGGGWGWAKGGRVDKALGGRVRNI